MVDYYNKLEELEEDEETFTITFVNPHNQKSINLTFKEKVFKFFKEWKIKLKKILRILKE